MLSADAPFLQQKAGFEAGTVPEADSGMSRQDMTRTIVHELTDALSRRVSLEVFAKNLDIDVEQAHQLKAEIINSVLLRRMLDVEGERVTRVPTTGVGVFAYSTITRSADSCTVEIEITVTNELYVELTELVLECVSFTNPSMTALDFSGPLELVEGSAKVLAPRASLVYRAQYVPTVQDFNHDGLLICSFVAQGYSQAGEWATGQEDAWVELGGHSALASVLR